MSMSDVKKVTFKKYDIRYYVVGKVAYVCPADLVPIMALDSKDIDIEGDEALDKVEAGRKIFPYFEFFDWFSEQFDQYDYSDDVILLDPMPW
ncbi:hypothetical protein [Desulfovibrio sp. JC022]|uniref:hypothetical protein n=1 Tax=Desulfovibrio sp. JC022 TaxID=2593642 RepID=UPI0013D381D9|nr:hypothetical protein [Desulfovibrio sp. JC022]NDV21330.1 hypothetical protein [Desulfovibrio sp. JC022]